MKRLIDIPLLPCPFCGASAVITTVTHAEFHRFYAICTNTRCACSLVPRNTANQAATDWNRRLITLRASLVRPECRPPGPDRELAASIPSSIGGHLAACPHGTAVNKPICAS